MDNKYHMNGGDDLKSYAKNSEYQVQFNPFKSSIHMDKILKNWYIIFFFFFSTKNICM